MTLTTKLSYVDCGQYYLCGIITKTLIQFRTQNTLKTDIGKAIAIPTVNAINYMWQKRESQISLENYSIIEVKKKIFIASISDENNSLVNKNKFLLTESEKQIDLNFEWVISTKYTKQITTQTI